MTTDAFEEAVAELGERVSEFLAEGTERSTEDIEDDVVRACELAADHELQGISTSAPKRTIRSTR